MGFGSKRIPLPAPTDSSTENLSTVEHTDVATDLSQRTLKSSYSIPEDGTPLVLPYKKSRTEKPALSHSKSQSSLLIEYFEAGKSKDNASQRPSVRVRVTPHGRKAKGAGDLGSEEIAQDLRPSHTRRISLEGRTIPQASRTSRLIHRRASSLPQNPTEADTMQNESEVSVNPLSQTAYVPAPSDISSMPADSMLDGPAKIVSPKKTRSHSPENVKIGAPTTNNGLKAPSVERSRSKSKERITRKAIEKLTRETSPEGAGAKRRSYKSAASHGDEELKPRSRRSSKSQKDSATDSSLVPHRDADSNLSGASKYSLNNPKLLQTIDDAIRRLILPEIETIKRHQSVRSTGTRDSFTSESTMSRTDPSGRSHRISRDRPKASVDHEDSESGVDSGKRKHRRRSHRRSTEAEKTHSRGESIDSIAEEKERLRSHKDKVKTRRRESDASNSPSLLTRSNLKSHTSRSSIDSRESHNQEKRRHREKSRSRAEEKPPRQEIPPMPMNSDVQDSELTRESILSAETAESLRDTERPHTGSFKTAGASARDIASPTSRGTELLLKSPQTTRSRGDKSLSSPRSDRSISTKARAAALSAAGLGGAAGALYGHHEKSKHGSRRSSSGELRSARSRDASPSQHTSNVRPSSKAQIRDPEHPVEPAKAGGSANVLSGGGQNEKSMESVKSTSSVDYPLTRKRHQGVNLEDDPDIIDELSGPDQDEAQDEDPEKFYERQHELNDRYRSSADYEDQQESLHGLRSAGGYSAEQSPDAPSFGRAAAGQQVQGVGANPEVVHTPHQAESAVASLLDPSTVSSQSVQSPQFGPSHKPDIRSPDETGETQQHIHDNAQQRPWLGAHPNPSAERWNALRGHAQRLSNSSPTKGPVDAAHEANAHSSTPEEIVRMGKSGMPVLEDPLPEIGHGLDDHSEAEINPSLERKQPSVIEGPLGDHSENQGTWPYEPTTPSDKRRSFMDGNDHEEHNRSAGNATLMGAAAGLGIGGVATQHEAAKRSQPSFQQERSQSSADEFEYGELPPGHQFVDRGALQPPSPGNMKDEGYVSAPQPDAASPLSFSKPPPRLFEDSRQAQYDSAAVGRDPFVNERQQRGMSGGSYDTQGDTYDAATGTGINNIQSKDVVALMDHLTVRDGQRNARDTEILVTLVRSAAEMRTSFEDMKKFIETQNKFNISQSDQQANRTVSKIVDATKAGSGSAQGPRSNSASDRDDLPSKRRNIFKRALSGLSGKNEKDLTRIEEMLMQLLDEVEGLRDAQSATMSQRGVPMSISQARPSLDSYERLRAAPESGYEPDGQAGTSSTPNQSGNLSTQSPFSRSAQRMHSGYDVRGNSAKRISTVHEADERMAEDPRYENDDGMLTPTQEAQKHREQQYETPPSGSRGVPSTQLTPNTPRTAEDRYRQRSAGSSIFGGMPKISRWSKTTTSSAPPERNSYQHDRPYSEASRSGSSVNVVPNESAPYKQSEDDRLRSANSLARDQDRSPSPLIPDGSRNSLEDPKYRANRQSLTLQHPQPRQGSTHRHKSHLESQAFAYGGDNRSAKSLSDIAQPDNDAFGSVPSLARNRPTSMLQHNQLGAGYSTDSTNRNTYLSPLSSDGGYNAPPRPPKIKDNGPLVPAGPQRPPKIPHEHHQRNSIASEPESVGGESCDSLEQQRRSRDSWTDEEDASPEGYEDARGHWIEPIPLPRKQSPYQAGGLLAPIEERYSLEQTRSTVSTPPEQRPAAHGRGQGVSGGGAASGHNGGGTARREEPDEMKDDWDEDRANTPTMSARAAMGATKHTAEEGRVVSGARRISGPREMPGRVASGGSQGQAQGGAQLQGTVRRKPGPGDF